MATTVLILFAGLEIKHYVADYLLQPPWLLRGKGSLTQIGGYLHAGIHVFGSLLVFLVAGIPLAAAAAILAGEFVVHYAIDYVKYRWLGGVEAHAQPWRYWALHGGDQLMHQLTYVAMTGFALAALGL